MSNDRAKALRSYLTRVGRVVLACVLIAVAIWPMGIQPQTTQAAPPPPISIATPTPQPTEPGLSVQGTTPPSPDHLPPEVEQARARQAMEAALAKHLRYWGPRYQVAPIEVAVEGEWARGVAQWQSETKTLSGPIHILAHRSADGTWQALLPSSDGLYRQWVDAVPESLVPAGEKSRLRVQVAEADDLGRLQATPVIPPAITSTLPGKVEPSGLATPTYAPLAIGSLPPVTPEPVREDPTGWTQGYSLIILNCSDLASFNTARDYVISHGGRLAVLVPPHAMLGWISSDLAVQITGQQGIEAIYYNPVDPLTVLYQDEQTLAAVRYFNFVVSRGYENEVLVTSVEGLTPLDDYRLPPPLDYQAYLENLKAVGVDVKQLEAEDELVRVSEVGAQGNSDDMKGTVAVTLFFVESNGSIDANRYTWTSSDVQDIYNKAVSGLSWWAGQASNRGISLTFYVYRYNPTDSRCQTGYEPILHSSGDVPLWVERIMANFGYTSGDHIARTTAYNTWAKSHYSTDWAYSAFIEYNPSPARTSFTDGRSAWAWLGGPYTNLLFRSFGWPFNQVFAHETGHIFWACDEYCQPGYSCCSGCDQVCSDGVVNGNCESCNPNSVDCMMKSNSWVLCDYTVGHLGWSSSTCPAPSLIEPADGATLSNHTITFRWNAPGCTPDGYTFRVKTVPDMDSGGTTLVDRGEGGTQTNHTFGSEWDNIDLYWSVRACKPCTPYNPGAWAPSRRLRIWPQDDGVYLCRNTGYNNCMRFTSDAPSLGNAGFGNDDAESIQMIGDWSAVLFVDDNYGGTHSVFNGSDSNLGDNPIGNNQASSMRVRKRNPANFTLYDLGDWNGASFPSDRTISDLGHWDFNDRAESIRVASGYEVVVCEHADFHGVCGRTNHDAADLNAVANGLRNGASSVRVCTGSCPAGPSTPTLIAPSAGAIIAPGSNVTFQWTGDGTQYYAEYWGGAQSGNSGWINGTQWSPGSLPQSSNPYYWRVKAWNGYGESGWSAQRSFYVQNRPTPNLSVSASPNPVTMSSGTYANVTYTFNESTGTSAHITQRTAQFTLLDGVTPVSDPIGPYGNDINVPANGSAQWVDNFYLPPDVVSNAQAYGASAVLLRTTFSGQDPLSRSVSVQSDLQINFVTCNDSTEPNNSPGQATAISIGQTRSAYICPSGDYDYYRFNGTAGQKIVIDVDAQSVGSSLDSYIYLLDSDGSTVLALNDDEPTSLDSKLSYQLLHNGTYYVRVRDYSVSEGGNDYFYSLRVFVDDVAPSAQIVSPGPNAWLEPNLQTITTDVSDNQSGIRHVTFYWHDADWNNPDWVVLSDDWNPNDGWTYDWDTSSIPEQQGGCVFIYAYDWAGNYAGWGSYGLGMDRTPPTAAANVSPMYGDAPFLDFYVWWYGSDNLSDIASYDIQYRDGSGGNWADLLAGTTNTSYRFVGQNGHTYYFRARARDWAGNQSTYAGGSGDAQRTVQICTISADAREPDNSYSAAKTITTDGAWQSHNFHAAGDQDWVTFTATAGISYTLVTTNTGGHADTVLYLYKSDGSTLIDSNDDDPGNWPASRLNWGARRDGTYYVKVEHWDPHAYGCTTGYRLSIAETGTFEVSSGVFLPIILKNVP